MDAPQPEVKPAHSADKLAGEVFAEKPERRRRRRHRSRGLRRIHKWLDMIRWRIIVLVILVTLSVTGAGALVLITNAFNRLEQSQRGLDRILTTLNNKPADQWTYADFERLQASVKDILNSLDQAERRTVFLKPVKGINSNLKTMFTALEAAQEVGLAVDSMLTGLRPTLFFLTEGQDDANLARVSSGERVIELLELGRGNFIDAGNHLNRAAAIINDFNKADISPDLLLLVEEIRRYQEQAANINRVLLDAPGLLQTALGIDDSKTYLILAQNNDEIRPSGGYISTYGWMTVRNSRIVEFDYRPTTPTSPNPPPASMADTLAIPDWWIQYQYPIYAAWDASWYADFPSTAEMAAWFYDNGNNPHSPIDGVLAIDIIGLEYMLDALGEVTVPGYSNTITADNFRAFVYEVRAEGQGDAYKEFLAILYREAISSWQDVDPALKSKILGAQLRALREKHIMLYFANDDLNRALDILQWSGYQEPASDHDYLMVADANVGANKANRSIIRQTTYDVEILNDGSLRSRATVAYDYSDAIARNDPAIRPENYRVIDYFNQMQVFAPVGSTLTDASTVLGDVIQVPGNSHTIFTALVWLRYDTSERYQYSYTTPAMVEGFGQYRRYRLLIQKQPGTLTEAVSVQVRLPPGTSAVDVNPDPRAEFALEQPILEFRINLDRDQWIEVLYQQ